MRFMMIHYPKVYETAKPGWVPDFKEMEEMGKYNDELGKAGVLLALDGLTPPATMSARVTFKDGKSKVTDGPFRGPPLVRYDRLRSRDPKGDPKEVWRRRRR